MPNRASFRAIIGGLCCAALVMSGGPALADTVTVDADTVDVSSDVNVAGSCTLPVTRTGSITFSRSNSDNPKKFDKNGPAVSVSYSSAHNQVSAAGSESVTVPSSYTGNGDNFSVPFTTTIATGDNSGATNVTVTATQGDYTKTTTYSASWDCQPANTPPTVSVTGVEHAGRYEFGAVPVAGCSWADAQDGSGTVTPTLTGPSGARAEDGLGVVVVACSKTDSGTPALTGTASASYTIQDTTGPSIPILSDVQAAATDGAGAEVSYSVPDATDAVDGSLPLDCTPASGSLFSLGSTTVTCSATDAEGNPSTGTFRIRVTDQTAPVVTVPDPVTLDATSPAGAVPTFTATAEDNVDGAVSPACNPNSGTTFDFGTTIVTCTATDDAGNTGSASFSVTVQDVTDPTLTVPSPPPAEATGPSGAVVHWAPVTATDDVDGPINEVLCDAQSGNLFPLGETPVLCSATDSHGNEGTNAFTVTVRDTTGPEITVPADFDVEASSSAGALVGFADRVSAHDLVDGSVDVACTPASGGGFGLGPTLVTCTSTDSRGNAAEPASFTVTVVDTTPPAIPALNDVDDIEATSPAGATVNYTVDNALDTVDGAVALVCTPSSGSTFALGTTSVTCRATDTAGNFSEAAFAVEVVDTTAPEFGAISVPTTEAVGPLGAQVEFVVTATDLADADPAVACDAASGSWFAVGPTAVTCTATDASGNVAHTSFVINVADTTGPTVESLPNVTLEATSAAGAEYEYSTPSANDLVDGSVSVACAPESGGAFPLGTTTVTCSATDEAGNPGSSSFRVAVQDTTAPTIDALADISVAATSASGAVASYPTPTATDLVDGAVAVDCGNESGDVFALGTTTVTCSATDAAGNTASRTFTVTVEVSWSGVLSPVDLAGSRTFKQGSTIPVKFALTGASSGISGLEGHLYVRRVATTPPGSEVAAVPTSNATGGNQFRYTGSQYIFNLATRGLAPGTYQLRIDLGDGVPRIITVVLR